MNNRQSWRCLAQAGILILIVFPAGAEEGLPEGIKRPAVPFQYGRGLASFQEKCAACHGKWAFGTDQGPPLIHKYYRPNHHADVAFYRAIQFGVRAHHWRFGDMAPVEGVDREEAGRIIPFIRWWQQENGIK